MTIASGVDGTHLIVMVPMVIVVMAFHIRILGGGNRRRETNQG
jgi:hypothetical protein